MSMNDAAAKAAQAFRDEAQELLAELEEALLELENSPSNTESIGKAFRAMHTIKGSGAMFGFDELARFTHDVETVLDRVRNGEIEIKKELLTLILRSKDHIQALLQTDRPLDLREASDSLILEFKCFLPASPPKPVPAPPAVKVRAPEVEEEPEQAGESSEPAPKVWELWHVRYRPAAATQLSGTKPLGLLEELAALGIAEYVFHGEDIPVLERIDPSKVYSWWDILVNTAAGEEGLRDVFIFVEDEGGVHLTRLGEGQMRQSDLAALLTVFTEQPGAPFEVQDRLLRQRFDSMKRMIQEKKAEHSARVAQSVGQPVPSAPEAHAVTIPTSVQPSSIRVDYQRLDELVNMVGEMVILQSRLSQAARTRQDPLISQIAEDMERLTDEMRDSALAIRMLPFGTIFSSLRRLVRDLATNLNKEVEFVTEGEDTELDKTVIDKLKDPLMHILRNSIDHGLEPGWLRKEAGKPSKGTIRLAARHSSGEVIISVSDDGRGIDTERVRKKGIERGLIQPEVTLTEKEIINLLFEPGFSTAETVSNISGRGVGMDVVRRGIDSLRGNIDVESHKGEGTTISIRLPLTLAIIDGLNVKIGAESYIVPLSTIEACQERFVEQQQVETFDVIERMGKMIPCISLRRLLQVPGDQPDYERVIIAGIEGDMVGLAVDVVIGRQQAVIKSLNEQFRRLDWISGTTVSGDGSISIILDVPQLVRFASRYAERLH